MTMTQACKTGIDPSGGNVTVSNTGPDSVDACGEAATATATWTYERVGAWKYTGTYERNGPDVTGSIALEDGEDNTPIAFGGTLDADTVFSPDTILLSVQAPWENFPGPPFLLGYGLEGSAELTATNHDCSYTRAWAGGGGSEVYVATLTWACIPRPESCYS